MKNVGKIPASVSIIAFNEEAHIRRCLESVKDFAEVVVVIDGKTTDRTADICREFGCRVYVEEWKGFGPQKKSAIDKCTNEWVLVIDADEALPPETAREMSRSLTATAVDAFRLPRKNFLHGRWMRHGDWWPDFQVRLVRKSRGSFLSMVHERWETKGSIGTINRPIFHYSFSGYSEMIKTMNDYSSLIARDLFSRGVKANSLSPAVHGVMMFFRIYVLKAGFLDGLDGLVTALLKGGGSFFKYAKILELQRREMKNQDEEKSRDERISLHFSPRDDCNIPQKCSAALAVGCGTGAPGAGGARASVEGKIPASASIVACNEEARISECLESLRDFSEIVVVVDAKTTDRTEEICRWFGCRVFVEEWKGYGPQNRSALDKCSHEWVLILDADERIPSEAIETIRKTLSRPGGDAYSFPRKNFLHGRWMKHGDWWPDRQVRLMKKNKGDFVSTVHARWKTRGLLKRLPSPIEHYSFNGYRDMINTLNNYSGSTAEELDAAGEKAHVLSPCLHGSWMFMRIYVLKKGFLDGLDGLVTAVLKAGGSFFKYAKLIELRKSGGR